jgi:TP901 family phage tail tape measure protein
VSEVANLYVTLRSETAPFTRGMRQASAEGESFTTRMGGLGALVSKVGKATTVAGLAIAGVSVKMAGDFQASMVRLKTSAGESGDVLGGKLTGNLKKVSDGVLDLAVKTGTSTGQLSAAMYKIESAGFHGAKGLAILKSAAEGARAEGADLEPVANTLDSTMNAFGFSAAKSNNVMNAFVATVSHGKLTMNDLAASLSTVTSVAGQAGVSLQQVLGAMSTMSAQGVSAQQSAQNLQFTLKNLKGPSGIARTAMASIGVDATDVAQKLGKRGLTGTFDLLNQAVTKHMGKDGLVVVETMNKSKAAMQSAQTLMKAMTGDTKKLAQSYMDGKITLGEYRKQVKGLPVDQANLATQFKGTADNAKGFNKQIQNGGGPFKTYADLMRKITGGSAGLNTALQLGGIHAKTFKDDVRDIGKAAGDSSKHVHGFAETQKTFNQQMRVLHAQVETAAIKLGTVLLPVVQKLIGFFEKHTAAVKALAVVIGLVLTGAVMKFIVGALSPLAKGLVGAAKGTTNLIRGFSSAEAAASASTGKIGSFGGALRKSFDAAVSGAKTAGSAVASFGRSVGAATATAGKAAWGGMVSGIKAVGVAMKTASLAALNFSKSMLASAVAGLRAAAAWVAQKVALVASTIAEKAAAVAQWALNVAMDANPIGLIVIALVALVGGLVLAYNKVGWFRAFVNGAFSSIATVVGWVVGFIKNHWQLLIVILGGPIGLAVVLVIKYWKQISTFVSAAVTWVVGFVKGHWQLLFGLITGPIGLAVGLVVKYWGRIAAGFSAAYHATVNVGRSLGAWVAGLPGRIYGWISGLAGGLSSRASAAWSSFKAATISKASEALTWIRSIPGKARSALGNLGGLLVSAGRALLQGFVNGIKSMASPVASAAHSVLSKISGLFPHSPAEWGPFSGSGWTLHSGRALMQGLVAGINDGSPRAVSTMAAAAQATSDAFARTLGIASPSKVFRQLGIYVNEGLVDGLTGSTARVKAATRRIESLLIQTYNKVADLKGHKGVSNKWVRSHEATLKHLEAYAKKEDKLLRSLAAKRDSVASKLKTAQSRLATLQKAWSDEVKSVAQGVMQGFSIVTDAPQEGFALTAQDVVNKMRDQMNKAIQFAAELQALKKKGLSSDLLEQLAAAGVDQGGATAAALSGASKAQINQINGLNKTTKSAATSAGKAVADSMYKAGIRSAQGLVKGLQSQEKAIEKQMMRIAKAMEKAIKKALGIHSPSRVFAEIGTWIPKGLAKGVEGGTQHATHAVHRLAGAVAGAGQFAGAGLALAAGGGGATVVNNYTVNVNVAGSVRSDRDLRDVLEREMLRLGARNSTTYAPYKR